jgi:hypothetical protein
VAPRSLSTGTAAARGQALVVDPVVLAEDDEEEVLGVLEEEPEEESPDEVLEDESPEDESPEDEEPDDADPSEDEVLRLSLR